MGQKPTSVRTLKNSRANPQRIDGEDALHRALARNMDLTQDLLDPQPGPVEDRARTLRRKTTE